MKWEAKDISRYNQEKAYIDTVILPLIPISWDEQMMGAVREGEYIKTLSQELERQLMGRIVESPPFTYIKNEMMEERMKRLKLWETEIKANGVAQLFYITSDVDWKQVIDQLDQLIWLPSVPLEHMDAKHRDAFMDETVHDVLKDITRRWQQLSE